MRGGGAFWPNFFGRLFAAVGARRIVRRVVFVGASTSPLAENHTAVNQPERNSSGNGGKAAQEDVSLRSKSGSQPRVTEISDADTNRYYSNQHPARNLQVHSSLSFGGSSLMP